MCLPQGGAWFNKGITELQIIVGVRFRPAGKIYYFDPNGEQYEIGEKVIVETARGLEFGEIVTANREITEEQITAPLKKVVRHASPKDEEQVKAHRTRESEAFTTCEQKIKEHELPMSLVSAEYTFDGQKLIFYFTAENRVDFRELVRDLAATFKTRIELRQIGVRDEAKMLGGLGPCGRAICCATFLGDFQPVSIRMAKEQNLSLNPTKISGLCGRLMCCLRYECEHYGENRESLLDVGATVVTPDGEGKVAAVNASRDAMVVTLEGGRQAEFPAEEIAPNAKNGGGCGGKGQPSCGGKGQPACPRRQGGDG
jgi:cell fate regulator YaaT (PSP1 superfamily)